MALTKIAGLPDVVTLGQAPDQSRLAVRARLLGHRIDTRHGAEIAAAQDPAHQDALTIIFRDGVVVSIGLGAQTDAQTGEAIDALLRPHVVDPEEHPEIETTGLIIRPGAGDSIASDGQVQLADASPERLLLVATVLARSVILSRDEILVAEAFDRISPLVGDLRASGQTHLSIRQAMQLVGNAVAARHRIMGTTQANDRPDLLWDHPGLDRLYARLEAEYELDERAEVLERKFVALGDVAEVLLDIVRDKRAFRLELAIIVLIAFEIVLSLIGMAIR